MAMSDLGPRYEHKEVEERIYRLWEKSGYFDPDNLPAQASKTFCIIMPPPNANGALHIGHALFVTLEDIMTRFWRMRGRRALWLPGADHAGFETQVVFDKKLERDAKLRMHANAANGRTADRFTMSREELYKEIWDFTQENKKVMENQLRRLGASCDWSREMFTLDKKVIEQVYATFKRMYDDGLIYRDLRVVNWCPKHKTALSDLEVKYVERKDPLYYIKYGPLTLATVRPETKFGDTALAVNPKDKRYQKYIGKTTEAKGLLGPLKFKVIADEAVDPQFGTGVVKVTPAHDATDFDIWTRHKGEIPGPKIIIDENGRLTGETGPFKGLKVAEAREKVAEAMREAGILQKIEQEYVHQVATCYKCGNTLEPLPKPQWFVKMAPLAKPALAAVKQKKIAFYPEHSRKVFVHWLENIRDWNISRQIIWGIRIPAWFHEPKCIPKAGREKDVGKCKEIVISEKEPRCKFCDAKYIQDPDVFDTWFSSGQWPFAALLAHGSRSKVKGQRSKLEWTTKDFEAFYPTDVMETGADILFFWVARMVMFGLYRTGKIPFRAVYLHGLVRDKDRQKMSKSKGNVIDPLGVADVYGSDAVRAALVAGNTPGRDTAISEDKIRGYRNFATKLWNVGRFISMNRPADLRGKKRGPTRKVKLTDDDKKHIAQARKVKARVAKHIEKFEFHLALETAYHYTWHTFADKVIESAKPRLNGGDPEDKAAAYQTLETIIIECLTMLHPLMPFVTEEIYQKIRPGELLMVKKW